MTDTTIPTTFFKLPNAPEEFGVVLEPAKLRRLNFSALEFNTMQRAIIEYIQAYFPDRFNDFVPGNGIVMLTELVAYLAGLLSQRSDVLIKNSFLPTAFDTIAVSNHLQLINNKIRRATPAIVDISVTIDIPAPTSINISAGLSFTLTGPDNKPVTYEIYRAPNDFTGKITIPPGKRGVIAFGLEGKFATPIVFESAGGAGQTIQINDSNILESPIIVAGTIGNTTTNWRRIDTIERAGPNDEVFEVVFNDTGMVIKFGDNVAGKAPLAGQIFTISYRTGGGIRGRIASSAINETRPVNPDPPATAPIEILFRNLTPSNGGVDGETLDAAKKRAPAESATLGSAVSGENYAVQAKSFNHPVFGSALKAVATVRTSLNANVVELYVLAAGPNDIPVLPSAGLKKGMETFFADIDVLTDEVRVLDGAIKAVSVRGDVIISRSADPSLVKAQVDAAVQDFFTVDKFDLGTPLYLSTLYETMQAIDGVKFVKIYEPADDIIPSNLIDTATPISQIGFNQLITLGQTNIKFYFEI